MIWLFLTACQPSASELGPVSLGVVQRWSGPAEARDQHHATIALLPYEGLAVTWTRGPLESAPEAWLQVTSDRGDPVGTALPLAAGGVAAKTDVEIGPDGRLWSAYQTPDDGIWVERLDLPGEKNERLHVAPAARAAGNNSVDVAVTATGKAHLVWFAEGVPLATFEGQSVGAALTLTDGLPPVVGSAFAPDDSLSADISATPDGGSVVAWIGQSDPDQMPDTLFVSQFLPSGALDWEIALDVDDAEPPRRATVAVDSGGRISVIWRRREHIDWTTSESFLQSLDPSGRPLGPRVQVFDGVADDPVSALLGDVAVFAVWGSFADGEWSVWGAIFSFPEGAPLTPAFRIGGGDPHGNLRPHAAAIEREPGLWTLAVSWEEALPGEARVVFGRTGTYRE